MSLITGWLVLSIEPDIIPRPDDNARAQRQETVTAAGPAYDGGLAFILNRLYRNISGPIPAALQSDTVASASASPSPLTIPSARLQESAPPVPGPEGVSALSRQQVPLLEQNAPVGTASGAAEVQTVVSEEATDVITGPEPTTESLLVTAKQNATFSVAPLKRDTGGVKTPADLAAALHPATSIADNASSQPDTMAPPAESITSADNGGSAGRASESPAGVSAGAYGGALPAFPAAPEASSSMQPASIPSAAPIAPTSPPPGNSEALKTPKAPLTPAASSARTERTALVAQQSGQSAPASKHSATTTAKRSNEMAIGKPTTLSPWKAAWKAAKTSANSTGDKPTDKSTGKSSGKAAAKFLHERVGSAPLPPPANPLSEASAPGSATVTDPAQLVTGAGPTTVSPAITSAPASPPPMLDNIPATGTLWLAQAGSYASAEAAFAECRRLKDAGFTADVIVLYATDHKPWFSLLAGIRTGQSEAQSVCTAFRTRIKAPCTLHPFAASRYAERARLARKALHP